MRRLSLLMLLVLALLAPGSLAVRAESESSDGGPRNEVLGTRIEGEIAAGGVDVFNVPLFAGTALRVTLSTSGGGGGSGKGGPGVSKPTLVAMDPALAEIGRIDADAGDLRRTVGVDGTYRFEVRAGAYAGGYELRIEGQQPVSAPQNSNSIVEVLTGKPTHFLVNAPPGSTVEIEVRRKSGAAPSVDAVTDGLGRDLNLYVRDARFDRVRLEAIPVAVAGGLDVTVSGRNGGAGRYELHTHVCAVSDRPAGGDDHESRRVVMQLAPGTDAAAVAASLGWTLIETDGNRAVFETPAGHEGQEDEDAAEAESHHNGIVVAAPDVFANLPEGSQSNLPAVGSELGRASVEQQAAMAQVHGNAAHAVATGAGVVVAVLDGGVDLSHEFLAGHLLPGYDFVDGDADPSDVKNGLDDDGDGLIDEGYGHGTFVASLVLAAAPGAKILPVRVLDSDGRGLSSNIAAGIEWSVAHGATVLNLSFGTQGSNPTIKSAVLYALGAGVTVVASTGNASRPTVVDFPAALPGVIAVTALDATGLPAVYANAGTAAKIAAPGTDLVGAYPGGVYARWSGTSFAAALVSGGVALLEERRPNASPAGVAKLLAQRARPFRAAVPRATRRFLGAGILDLLRLVR